MSPYSVQNDKQLVKIQEKLYATAQIKKGNPMFKQMKK